MQRFKKNQHIRSSQDFEEIKKKGFRMVFPAFIVFIAKGLSSSNHCTSRIGIVASRRVGPSVKRNYGKRLMRQCFRLNQGTMLQNLDIVVILRHSFDLYSFKEIEKMYLSACQRAQRQEALTSL